MRKKKYAELQQRIEREKKLDQVELAMENKLLLKVNSADFSEFSMIFFCSQNPKQDDPFDDDDDEIWADNEKEKKKPKVLPRKKQKLSRFV